MELIKKNNPDQTKNEIIPDSKPTLAEIAREFNVINEGKNPFIIRKESTERSTLKLIKKNGS
jgi:hypothetical protein